MKYYQINTFNRTVKQINKNQALKKLYNRNFITCYFDKNYTFITQRGDNIKSIVKSILKYRRLKKLSLNFRTFLNAYINAE